jgi:hypothetical protein
MILSRFTHSKGAHCDTACLKDIFNYEGISLSEAALFGLGEGLGFYYRGGKNMSHPVFSGRTGPFEIDKCLCNNLGIGLTIRTSTSPKRAYEALKSCLNSGHPAMLSVDEHYLSYRKARGHNGLYRIVATGIEEESNTVFIADHHYDRLIGLPVGQLIDARASISRPFPPRNRLFDMVFPEMIEISKKAIIRSIAANSLKMVNPSCRNFGVSGIYHLGNCMRSWEGFYTKKEIGTFCKYAHSWIDSPETGGGCFRHMYSDFLKFAYEISSVQAFKDASEGYREAASMWSETAKMINGISSGGTALSEVSDILSKIASKEYRLQMDLLCATSMCCKLL